MKTILLILLFVCSNVWAHSDPRWHDNNDIQESIVYPEPPKENPIEIEKVNPGCIDSSGRNLCFELESDKANEIQNCRDRCFNEFLDNKDDLEKYYNCVHYCPLPPEVPEKIGDMYKHESSGFMLNDEFKKIKDKINEIIQYLEEAK